MADIPKWPEFMVQYDGHQDSDGCFPCITAVFVDANGRPQTELLIVRNRGTFVTLYEARNVAKRIKVLSITEKGVMTLGD